MSKPLHLIVACAENRVIGRAGKLPWRIPEDLAYFNAETAGKICLLGRICYETWPQVRANGRQPVVVTSNKSLEQSGVRVAPSFTAALAIADTLEGELYICGGEKIYGEAFAVARTESRPLRLHLTLIHADIAGDTYFPEWRHLPWREIARRESHDANYRYTFLTLDL